MDNTFYGRSIKDKITNRYGGMHVPGCREIIIHSDQYCIKPSTNIDINEVVHNFIIDDTIIDDIILSDYIIGIVFGRYEIPKYRYNYLHHRFYGNNGYYLSGVTWKWVDQDPLDLWIYYD